MAPLNKDEFFTFFDEYRTFSDCIDGLGRKQGLDSRKVAENLVRSGQAQNLLDEADSILAKDSSFHSSLDSSKFSLDQRVQVMIAALSAQGTNHQNLTKTRYLVTMGMAKVFVARASDGSCGPNKKFVELFDKARK